MRRLMFVRSIINPIGIITKNIKVLLLVTVAFWANTSIAKTSQSIEALFSKGHYSEITKKYGSKLRNLDVKKLIILNEAYERTDNPDGQIRALEQILKIKPDYFKVHYQLAEINKKTAFKKIINGFEYEAYEQNLNDMMKYYRSAIKLNRKSILPYRGLMEVFKKQENVQEGLALAKEMVNVFDETPETLLYMCQWVSKYGLVQQTRSTCTKASQQNPNNSEPFILLAKSYEDTADEDQYKEIVFSLLKRFPKDPEIIQRAGLIYYNNKNYINAEDVLSKNKNKEYELAVIYHGFALFKNQKYEESLASINDNCNQMFDHKKEMIRFYEMGLRILEDHEDKSLRFKFQRAINNCKTLAVNNARIKIRPGHFERGVRLPANTKDLDGSTVKEKRASYEMQRMKGNEYKPSSKANESIKIKLETP